MERQLGKPEGARLVIDQLIFDLSEADLLRLAQDMLRVLATRATPPRP